MKTVKSFLVSFVLVALVTLSATAQSKPKVIAVVNRADWCSVCKHNEKRAMADFRNHNKDGAIVFVTNDRTNAKTIAKSMAELKSYGLDQAIMPYKSTGMAYFFNPRNKHLISKISLSKSDLSLTQAMETAKEKL